MSKLDLDLSEPIYGLFNSINCRYETMLAYEASYFPTWHMQPQHKVVYSSVQYLTKSEVLARCDETLSFMDKLPQDRKFKEKPFKIHWAYGNVPTKTEWDRKYHGSIILVEFRISPLIGDGDGRVALLTPHMQKYYQEQDSQRGNL